MFWNFTDYFDLNSFKISWNQSNIAPNTYSECVKYYNVFLKNMLTFFKTYKTFDTRYYKLFFMFDDH